MGIEEIYEDYYQYIYHYALKQYSGLPFHIEQAKNHGANKEEIKSAMLIAMLLIGLQVGEALTYLC